MLEINRIIDIQGKILGLGPRPGFPSLKEQMNGVASLAARRPVVLVEDGTFSGATLSYIVKELKKRNVDIVSIVVGFAFQKGRDLIKEEHEFELEVVEKNHKLLDWVPDHDFVPFSPNCGRVFGVSINEVNYPFYTHDGASYCVPYIIPFAPMKEWTSINGESDKVREEISIFCLETACELFKYIERINRKTLLIGDLVAKSPSSVSVPISVGQKKFPEQLDKPIVGYLEKIYRHGILFLDPEEI